MFEKTSSTHLDISELWCFSLFASTLRFELSFSIQVIALIVIVDI